MIWKVLLAISLVFIVVDHVLVSQDFPINNQQQQYVSNDISILSEEDVNPRDMSNFYNEDFDFQERDDSEMNIVKRSTDKCRSHWSTRKCQRSRHDSSSNSTYVTCTTNSQCRHRHHCCTVHNHSNNGTIKCCVRHRRHKKKHHKNTTSRTTTLSS